MFEGFHAFDPGEIRSAQLLDPNDIMITALLSVQSP